MLIAWVVCIFGWLGVCAMPNLYESKSVIYIDTNSATREVLEKLTIESDVLGRVGLISNAMLGRPLLQKVARETDLHLRANDDDELI